MNMFKSHKKLQENNNPYKVFKNLDKITLLQEARYFNSSRVNPKKCIHILTKILYLLYQGEPLSVQEATHIFFSTTKLFQSNGIILRRLVYLSLKELSLKSQDVIIVTSSLTKDINGKEDMLRAAAIRTLYTIVDCTMLQGIERYMKKAIVDKNPAVSSAALVSALHQSAMFPELVRCWVKEAQEVIISDNIMVSYHALGVFANVGCINLISMEKLLSDLLSKPILSPYTQCLLIRYAAKLAKEHDSGLSATYIEFIESHLRPNISEIVIYEALHAIIYLCKSAKKLVQVMPALQMYCASPNTIVRLAGVRSLAKISFKHPNIVKAQSIDFENLIFDANKLVATMALITMLSMGTPRTIKQIIKPISSFMTDIPDEFKIMIVHAIERLFSKCPHKYPTILSYLGEMLHGEGSLEYKDAIISAMVPLIEGENRQIKENGLIQLCEFIEDCEHKALASRVLHILSREGPKTEQPSRFMRYIYNRVILESPPVRAAAVTTVARFGAALPELLSSVKVVLTRCQYDDNDEVRDRAVLYYAILESDDPYLINDYIKNVRIPNVIELEKTLLDHLNNQPNGPLEISFVTLIDEKQQNINNEMFDHVGSSQSMEYFEQRQEGQPIFFPGMESIGPLFKSCKPVDLTESGTEYRVRCVKHIFAHHLILQFDCLNTLCDRILQNVRIVLGLTPGYCLLAETPCEQLQYDKLGHIFLLLEFPKKPHESPGTFTTVLEFAVYNCDPVKNNCFSDEFSESYHDNYLLEDLEIRCGDQFLMHEMIDDFPTKWDNAFRRHVEVSETFGLIHNDLRDAAKAICEHLELPKSGIEGKDIKEIHGSGTWRSKVPVLIKARLVSLGESVSVQLSVRSPREDIASLLFVNLLPGSFV